ncbi:uncharacterized protein isoform X2 [Musca autumnalis]
MYTFLLENPNPNNSLDLESIRIRFHVSESEFEENVDIVVGVEDPVKIDKGINDKHVLNSHQSEADENSYGYDEREEVNFNDTDSDCNMDPIKDRSGDNIAVEPMLNAEEEYKNLDDKCKVKRKKKRRCIIAKKDATIIDFLLDAKCKECGEHMHLYSSCFEHMRLNHVGGNENRNLKCPVCCKSLKSWYNFERHMRTHIPNEERKTTQCTECESRFTSKAQLEAHINYKHRKDKPFICEVCGLSLRTYSNLRQHQIIIHTDIKPFECEVCKKTFKNSYRLKVHMDTHSPNKHICSLCGLQLNSRATLNRHFLVHSDDMKHKCDYCGRAFKRAKALKNHLILHTGLKPYACEFCERTFANGSNCRSHMKKLHPDQLAALEASGNKSHTTNIPKLQTLKAVTKGAENLTPVVTKFSGCFAFGKKPPNSFKQSQKSNNMKAECNSKKSSSDQLNCSMPQDGLHLSHTSFLSTTEPQVPDNAANTASITNLRNIEHIQNAVSPSDKPPDGICN